MLESPYFDAVVYGCCEAQLIILRRFLGFTTAGTVVLLDLALFLMHRSNVMVSLGPTLLFVTASRAALIGFGARYVPRLFWSCAAPCAIPIPWQILVAGNIVRLPCVRYLQRLRGGG
jgi:hypothetical protein